MAGQRLRHDERRAQLLDAASAVIEADGTEGLTLARVAAKAGVTKPIAYEHFKTRAGLLAALYQRLDERQTQAAQAALSNQAHSLEEAATVLATAYVDCTLQLGREFGAITAELSASADLEPLLQEGRQRYASTYRLAIEKFTSPPSAPDEAVMIGVIGAAEALTREAASGRLRRLEAIGAISHILVSAVSTRSPDGACAGNKQEGSPAMGRAG
ncbi:MAG TPA: TetR/AcrR family transcriptional regulator [Trebonia sp.]